MSSYAIRRAGWGLGTIVLASIVSFTLFWAIPNVDPGFHLGGGNKGNQQTWAQAREEWGLNEPLPVQYVELMRDIIGGSVQCFNACGNLRSEFFARLQVTTWLILGATLLAGVLATSTAYLCVRHHGSRLDRLLLGFAAVLHSVPTLVLTVVLWNLLCRRLEIFPFDGYTPITEDPAKWAWHLALPWLAAALPFAGAYTPILRAAMLDARSADWVRTARAKGLKESAVVRRHMLRTSLAAPVSVLGLDLSHAFGGYVLYVEFVFGIPGVGQLAEAGIRGLDLPAVVALTIWLSITVVVVSALVDLVVHALDPRATERSGYDPEAT
jgi:peptide/nickel transport system permease protein